MIRGWSTEHYQDFLLLFKNKTRVVNMHQSDFVGIEADPSNAVYNTENKLIGAVIMTNWSDEE